MVLGRKTNIFLGKRWFWAEKQLFPRKKMVLGRKTNFFPKTKKNKTKILWETVRPKSQKMFFFGFPEEKDGFEQENQLFPRKKMAFS